MTEDLGSLPQRGSTHVNETDSKRIFRALFRDPLFIVQREVENDYGTDYLIELLSGTSVTNFQSHVQLKASTTSQNSDGSYSYPVPISNVNYLFNSIGSIYVFNPVGTEILYFRWVDDVVSSSDRENPNWRTQESITVRYYDEVNQTSLEDIHKKLLNAHLELRKHRRLAIGQGTWLITAQVTPLPDEVSLALAQGIGASDQLMGHGDLPRVATTLESGAPDTGSPFDSRLDDIRSLLLENEFEAALALVKRVENDLGSDAVDKTARFRLALYKGSALFELDRFEEAYSEFSSALLIKPQDISALINTANAAFVTDRSDESMQYAMQAVAQEPKDPRANAIYIRCISAQDDRSKLDEFMNSHPFVADDPDCAMFIGQSYLKQGNFAEGEKFLRTAAKKEKPHPQALLMLAEAIASPIATRLKKEQPLRWRFPVDVREGLGQAIEVLNQAIATVSELSNRRWLVNALGMRAQIRLMLGDHTLALSDADAALQVDQSNELAKLSRGQALMHLERYGDAASAFEALSDWQANRDLKLQLAYALYQGGMYERALEVVVTEVNPSQLTLDRIDCIEVAINSLVRLGRKDEAIQLSKALREQFPDDPNALAVSAQYHLNTGETAEGIELLRKAVATTHPGSQDLYHQILANALYSIDDFSEAAKHYKEIASINTVNSTLRRYVVSLYNAGDYSEALSVAKQVREIHDVVPVISEIEAHIMFMIGSLDTAEEIVQSLLKLEPTKTKLLLFRTKIALRKGDLEAATKAVGLVQLDDVKEDPEALIGVARLRAHLEIGGELPFAYQAFRIAPDDPDTYLAYFGIFLARDSSTETDLQVEEVQIDTTVTLSNGQDVLEYTIVEESDIKRSRGELHISSDLAKSLLTKKVGDRIAIDGSIGGITEHEVTNIRSKYVSAFQFCANNYNNIFPDASGLHKISIPDNDFSSLFRVLDKQGSRFDSAELRYFVREVPFGFLCGETGNGPFDTWAHLVNLSNGKYFAFGDDSFLSKQRQDASSDSICLDFSAILTIFHLGIQDTIADKFKNIFVSRATVDYLNEEIEEISIPSKPVMTLGKRGGHYIRQEITPEQITARRNFFSEMREFILAKTRVVGSNAALSLSREEYRALRYVVGETSLTSMYVAQEHGVVLFADDLDVNAYASQELGVNSTSTAAVLGRLLEEGELSDKEYLALIIKLVHSNYRFVPISLQDFIAYIESENCSANHGVEKLLSLLSDRLYKDGWIANLCGDLIVALWELAAEPMKRANLVDMILDKATVSRNSRPFWDLIVRRVRSRLALAQAQLNDVLHTMETWAQQHAVRFPQ